MSAMPAERLREPESLYVPPEVSPEVLKEIVDRLSPEGGREFLRQVLEAVERAQAEGDLRPINLTVESWFRTLLVLGRPKFQQLWEEPTEQTETPLTLEDIRKRRAQRAR